MLYTVQLIMEINYLDFVAYIIFWIIAWYVSPEETKEELAILGWIFGWIVFTIMWIIVFVYPIDLNISDMFKVHWNIKMKP